ncbi:hypothetical protein JOF42_000367 [Microbacterium phyllosphaerae]|uniref:Uncharacterized protein n=1 Tax=Microbacterium phyllosphaerae TaxID=124798 RepID=A0ABS4WL02_9MICO|nr:hypothetical protein [Microbacterium phyllosphaerae]MBP2376872.1 hypothetical protein [Microbacterium phyllosphaerae]
MILLIKALWALGGVVLGLPVTAAMAELPNHTGGRVSLAVARDNARQATIPRRRRKAPTVSRKQPSDPWDEFLGWALGVIVAVYLYALWAVTIAVTMFWVSVALLAVAITVFATLYFRRAFGGGRTAGLLTMTLAYAVVGVLVALWLIEPPLHGVLPAALEALKSDAEGGIFPYLLPLGAQLLGALACFAVLLSSIAVCLANISAVLMEVQAVGHRLLWKPLFRATRGTTAPNVGWWFAVLAAFALIFSSGLATEWMMNLQSIPVDGAS